MSNYFFDDDGLRYPIGFDAWNQALRGAYRRGALAARAGLVGRDACPYRDRRTYRGAVTWSRSFITAWLDGYDANVPE